MDQWRRGHAISWGFGVGEEGEHIVALAPQLTLYRDRRFFWGCCFIVSWRFAALGLRGCLRWWVSSL